MKSYLSLLVVYAAMSSTKAFNPKVSTSGMSLRMGMSADDQGVSRRAILDKARYNVRLATVQYRARTRITVTMY